MSEIRSAVEALRAYDLAALGDDDLLNSVEELLTVRAMLDAVIVRRLEAAHRRESTVAVCGRTVRSWLHEELRQSSTDAGRRVAVARGLAFHPLLAAAFDAGDISFDHARLINACFRHLPTQWHESVEQVLVEAARRLPPDELGPVLDKARDTFGDGSTEEREQRRFDSRWCRASATFEGMVRLEAMLDPESGQTLLAAVAALMGARQEGDPRSAEQRRADALVDLARQSFAHSALPDHNGDRPHVAVTIGWDALRDAVGAATVGSVPVTPATARRLACDAQVIPVMLGSNGQALDVGRHSPTWTVHQRRAAALRDGGCVWPQCRAGLDRCQLHHLHHWARGGRSDIDNSAYVCHFHHWLVHHRNWTICRDAGTRQITVRRT